MAYAILRLAADQSIANNTATDINWDTEDADFGGVHSGSNATVSLSAGLWLMIADVSFAANSTGSRQIKITEGSTDIAFMENSGQGSAVSQRIALPILWVVPDAGATYKVCALQTSGGNLNVLGNRSSYFMVAQLA